MASNSKPDGKGGPVLDLRLSPKEFGELPAKCFKAGTIALGISLAFMVLPFSRTQMLYSYFTAYMFWLHFCLGSMGLLMIQYLTGGGWGVVIRRVLEAATRNIFWMPVLFLPLVLFHTNIYEWTHSEIVETDIIIQRKAALLNSTGWSLRSLLYFGIWMGMAYLLTSTSRHHDETGDPVAHRRLKRLSGPGIPILILSVTFAATDWLMSMEPHWFSSMYGGIQAIGMVLSSMALAAVVTTLLARTKPMCYIVNVGHLHDMGKFLLGFTMVWAYFNLSQFLIIWSANLSEFSPWYLSRVRNGWATVGGFLIFFHFLLPFLLLLSRDIKRNPRTLVGIGLYIIAVRLVDHYFTIVPSARIVGGSESLFSLSLLFVPIAVVGIGGLWLSRYMTNLTERQMLPVNEPMLQEALEVHGH
jgi:hypothetical protein